MGFLDYILRYSIRRYFYKKAFATNNRKVNNFCQKITVPYVRKPTADEMLEKEMFDQLDRGVGRKR